jgi:hypothetical protein
MLVLWPGDRLRKEIRWFLDKDFETVDNENHVPSIHSDAGSRMAWSS